MKIGVSAACDVQLFSTTFSIYGNETCFEFTVWVSKTHTVSDRCVMTFFKRRVGISQDSLREDSGALDTECLCFPPL